MNQTTAYSVSDTTNANIYSDTIAAQIASIRERYAGKVIGFTCSAFDLLHTGHALMLKDSKEQCDILVVGLQTDPTLNRPDTKNKPVQSFVEREEMLKAIRYVDEIIHYATEDDLVNILQALKPDVRILGTDWKDKPYTGHHLPIKIHWHVRDHPWSTTHLRERVHQAEVLKQSPKIELFKR